MSSLQQTNKALVLCAFDALFNKRDYALAETFWSPQYIQHSAYIAPGRSGLFDLIKTLPPTLKYENSLAMAEGDHVMLHGRFSGRGAPVNWIVTDIVRVQDGLLVEHWDVIQDEATRAQSRSGNPMFGNAFPAEPQPPPQQPPGEAWIELVRKNGTPEFAAAFTPDATLRASVLNGTLVGPAAISAFFGATSQGMYETLMFTNETKDGMNTCYQWQGRAFGAEVAGVTVVTRNVTGLIERVQLFHRPYSVLLQISAELSRRLAGKVDAAIIE